jgi:hypothetical protein
MFQLVGFVTAVALTMTFALSAIFYGGQSFEAARSSKTVCVSGSVQDHKCVSFVP